VFNCQNISSITNNTQDRSAEFFLKVRKRKTLVQRKMHLKFLIFKMKKMAFLVNPEKKKPFMIIFSVQYKM